MHHIVNPVKQFPERNQIKTTNRQHTKQHIFLQILIYGLHCKKKERKKKKKVLRFSTTRPCSIIEVLRVIKRLERLKDRCIFENYKFTAR